MELFEEQPEVKSFDLETVKNPARALTRRRLLAALVLPTALLTAYGGSNEARTASPEPIAKSLIDGHTLVPTIKETEAFTDTVEGLRDPAVLHRAEQIISTFENSTTEIQYDYAEELDDGRGITAGRAGFTSETGDLLLVVQAYADMGNEDSELVTRYLPILKAIENGDEDAAEDLGGFIEVWKEAAKEQDLRDAQDLVYKQLYLEPALKRADDVGVKTALGQTIILDTIIQHGEGDDVDGLPSIMDEAKKKAGTPENQEEKWLNVFLDIRKNHLLHAADPETRHAWMDSVDRVEALRSILATKNMSLTPPITWTVYGDPFSITE